MFLQIIKISLVTTFLTIIFPIYLIFNTITAYSPSLVSKDSIMNSNDTGIVLFDRNDRPFFVSDGGRIKKITPSSQIPKTLKQAVIASEDKDFYIHPGFSIKAIARSVYRDLESGKFIYGGSTITQQLVKNTLLNSNRSFLRKFQEVVLAYEIERRFSKDDILEMYLNSVYFGDGAYGAQEAAQTYFGKDANNLSLAESSILAGLLPSPSKFSPITGNLEQSNQRQEFVLQRMIELKYISQEEKSQAENEELVINHNPQHLNFQAQHFALMARDELIQKYGADLALKSGFRVKTTIDLDWQAFAEETVASQVAKLAPNRVTNGAAVVVDPKTGEVKAAVGSVDWFNENFGKVNITTSLRQPGSSFKPIIYAAGFEKHIITPTTILKDQPVSYGGTEPGSVPYQPQDYDRKFRGQVTARRALANSLNVPSVEVLSKVGIDTSLEMAQRLGITTLSDYSQYGLSLALGAGEVKLLELTGVYATFANLGEKNDLTTILEVRNKHDEIIYTHNIDPKPVLDPDVVFLISSILSDSQTRAEIFGATLNISRPAAVKTGTSENYRDSWTLGYTPSLTVGVWVGNNDGTAMDNVAGSLGAAPIWQQLMEKFSQDVPVQNFEPPENVISLSVCRNNGLILKEATSSGYTEYFIKGTEPTGTCYPETRSTPASTTTTPPSASSSANI